MVSPSSGSLGDLEAGWTAWFLNPAQAGCSISYGSPSDPGPDGYNYGIFVSSGNVFLNNTAVFYTTSSPACPYTNSENLVYTQARTVSCPVNESLTYTSSPLVGPYCALPPSTVNPAKQGGGSCPGGCPTGSSGGNSGAADAGSGQTTQGNSVDVSNGYNFERATDYSGVGNNPLKFVRTYSSLSAWQVSHFGATAATLGEQYTGVAWSATYFQYLLPVSVTDSTTTYNTVYAYRPDGRVLVFNESGGVYSPDGDVADSLAQTASGWQYQTTDDTIETYNSSGQLISIATRGQSPLTINYSSGSGLGDGPTSVSDAFGHALTFSYLTDASGAQRLASITDPAGKTVQYSYDLNGYGNLITVTQADGTTVGYSYASYPNNLLQTVTDESGTAYKSWTYASYGEYVATSQLAGSVDAYTFSNSTSGSGGSVTVTDPLGQERTFNQSLIWGLYRTTSASAVCLGCGEDESRIYDANGNITSRTDFNGNETTYVYNEQANLETSRTEALTSTGGTTSATRTITTTWNSSYREPALISVYTGASATGTPLRTTAYTYSASGSTLTKTITDTTVTPNVTRVWTYTYDTYGRMLTAKGPRTDVNSTTTYAYYTCTTGTQCGELQTVTDPVGNVTTYNTYNAHGQPLTITDPNGVVTTLTYDARMRLTSRQVSSETTSFSYYAIGLLQTVTLPDGSTLTYTYDTAHRLTQIADGLGNKVVYTLDAMGNRTATNTYDPSSVLHYTHTRVMNALNQLYQDISAAGTGAVTTTFGYDGNGNQNSIDAPLSRDTANTYDQLNRLNQITDPETGITQFTYDANDNLLSVKDPRSLSTSYVYNGFGDITKLTSPDSGVTTNTYDSGGNLATSTDARSAVSTYAYDAANRMTSTAYKSGSSTDLTETYTYDTGTDGKGRLVETSDANQSLTWVYDAYGEVTSKKQIVAGVTLSVGYAYTNADLTTLTTPSGQTIVYGYNTNHQVTSVTVNGAALLTSATYEPLGSVNGWSWGNGTSEVRAYNTDGNLAQVNAIEAHTYAYDNALRISGITNSSNSALSWTYGYDLLDRITSGAATSTTLGWTYDADGNRLTQTGSVAGTYTPSTTSNRLNSITGSPARTYTYDAAGHTLTYASDTFTFYDDGRMKTAKVGSSTTTYVYNALGQRIEKSGGTAGTVLMSYDQAGHILGEYSSTGALVQETVWMGDIPVATIRPNGSSVSVYYVHADHLNAPRMVTQPSTNDIAWRWDTDPFGTASPNQNPAGLGTFSYNLRYPGQYYDVETGLNQNYLRDFDPATGRYVESDPIGLKGGINTYAYATGSPVLYTDRLGLDVVVAYFPGGPGHVGIGVNSANTTGFYPMSKSLPVYLCRDVLGAVLYDQKTQDATSTKYAQYITIHTTPAQDEKIQSYIEAARNAFEPKYNACSNQCTNFVRGALETGGVPLPGDVSDNPSLFFENLKQTYGPSVQPGK
jgi:RHS repeat-associated protein